LLARTSTLQERDFAWLENQTGNWQRKNASHKVANTSKGQTVIPFDIAPPIVGFNSLR